MAESPKRIFFWRYKKRCRIFVKLHGTEAVVPLPNGRSIPVEMSGTGAQTNNVSVSVNINNDGSAETTTEDDAKGMGKAIAAAVQREIQHQKRPGGMLSPYGGTR